MTLNKLKHLFTTATLALAFANTATAMNQGQSFTYIGKAAASSGAKALADRAREKSAREEKRNQQKAKAAYTQRGIRLQDNFLDVISTTPEIQQLIKLYAIELKDFQGVIHYSPLSVDTLTKGRAEHARFEQTCFATHQNEPLFINRLSYYRQVHAISHAHKPSQFYQGQQKPWYSNTLQCLGLASITTFVAATGPALVLPLYIQAAVGSIALTCNLASNHYLPAAAHALALDSDKKSVIISYKMGGESDAPATLERWSLDGRLIKKGCTHDHACINQIAVAPNGTIVTSSSNGAVNAWDKNLNITIPLLKTDAESAAPVAIGQSAIVIACGTTIVVTGLDGSNTIHINKAHDDTINTVKINSDNLIISGSDDKTCRVWKLDGTHLQALKHDDAVTCVLAENDTIITGSRNGQVSYFQKKDDSYIPVTEKDFKHATEIHSLAVDEQTGALLVGNQKHVWVHLPEELVYKVLSQLSLQQLKYIKELLTIIKTTPQPVGTEIINNDDRSTTCESSAKSKEQLDAEYKSIKASTMHYNQPELAHALFLSLPSCIQTALKAQMDIDVPQINDSMRLLMNDLSAEQKYLITRIMQMHAKNSQAIISLRSSDIETFLSLPQLLQVQLQQTMHVELRAAGKSMVASKAVHEKMD